MPTTVLNRRITMLFHAMTPQERLNCTMQKLVEMAGGLYWF